MASTCAVGPIVVGVDGSQAALEAVRWAVDEAVARSAPLRLVHATGVRLQPDQSDDDFRLEREYAETVLRAAAAAARSNAREVSIDTEVLWGPPDAELVAASRTAAMVCVGSVGIGAIASVILGSTAVAVSRHARCCVAVLRGDAPPGPGGCLVVATDATSQSDPVVVVALDEARLRGCSVVIVGVRRWDSDKPRNDEMDRHGTELARRYPEVPTEVVALDGGIVRYLADRTEGDVAMVVVGDADAEAVADIVGPHDAAFHRARRHSVLVVR